ncbi:hypothetical protein OG417_34845 [Actinoallomurus sp. NBC_01490]|uniref:hypothetical protein n=1 Tax=Actinoallomurus sp. NBC_01490 TaxID=2903557 RepID=UPI002E356D83|nr:hypothetical protein [Actinoallomurus sp. NBC_01490]
MNRATTWWAALSLAMKAALAGLLLFALAHPHWDRFADKAMGIRAMTYPIAAVLVPVVWSIVRRLRGSARYPWDVDALVVAPFVIDVAGNAATSMTPSPGSTTSATSPTGPW